MRPDDLVLTGRRTLEKEAKALASFVDTLDESFARACELIYSCRGTVLLTGMGKSGLVARKWASTFSGTGTKAYFINPAEASHGDLGLMRPDDVLVALSYSGETAELGYVLRHALESGVETLAVTGNLSSSLARQAKIVVSVKLSEEACPLGLAPTTSTTIMMSLGDAFAVTLMQMRGFTEQDFARLHPGGSLGRRLWLRVHELMHHGDSIPRIAPDDRFENVLVEMTRKCLGLAVVMDGETVLGIITDGDLRRAFQGGKVTPRCTAAELMTPNPRTISAKALAVEAGDLLEETSKNHLLAVDEAGRLVGILHLQDLLRAKVV